MEAVPDANKIPNSTLTPVPNKADSPSDTISAAPSVVPVVPLQVKPTPEPPAPSVVPIAPLQTKPQTINSPSPSVVPVAPLQSDPPKSPPVPSVIPVAPLLTTPQAQSVNRVTGTCPKCHQPIQEKDYFCANCGYNFHTKPPSTSIGSQLMVYIGSVFLFPMGFIWGIRYITNKDAKVRSVGIICLLISAVMFIVLASVTVKVVNQVNDQVNQQMEMIQGL